ncbi:putative polyketide biosynthesis enoyl-CoA hydratase PksH [bacterium BMS3Abin04]|nr:putative polyketide biosynthesis enoyl-CoA hydratase PksH [bacterium BMS3Abin04]
MENEGFVKSQKENGIATVSFFHAKSNSLLSSQLKQLKKAFDQLSEDTSVNVIILRSEGEKAFCAGASFDELLKIENFEQGKEFFMGFARLVNAMRRCNKIIIGRIHGKAVGGGVGLVAATDYALATKNASLKLSELAIGLGPFVVGPPIERKIGVKDFNAMSLDCEWRSAEWGREHGFYKEIFDTIENLDKAIYDFATELASRNPEALKKLKRIFWEGTEHWDKLLEERAENSGKLVLSDFTKEFIKSFKSKK